MAHSRIAIVTVLIAVITTHQAGAAEATVAAPTPDQLFTNWMHTYRQDWATYLQHVSGVFQTSYDPSLWSQQVTPDADNNIAGEAAALWEFDAGNMFANGFTFATNVFEGMEKGGMNFFQRTAQASSAAFVSFVEPRRANWGVVSGASGVYNIGGGFGGGVQVYDCQNNMVLDMGFGFGWGATVSQAGQLVTSGAGGGGGIQVLFNGQSLVNLGGGAGGGAVFTNAQWTPSSGGSNDGDESEPMDVLAAMQEVAAQSCKPFTISAGGGAGGGAVMQGGFNGNYGAGYTWSYGSAPAGANTDPSGGSVTSKIVDLCNSECVSQNEYDTCFCPCFQQQATAANLSWASSIKCQ